MGAKDGIVSELFQLLTKLGDALIGVINVDTFVIFVFAVLLAFAMYLLAKARS
jgi:hypothetical protein